MLDRAERWTRRKAKHRNDHDHGKRGRISGNLRYHRKRAMCGANVSMGRNR